MKTIFNNKLGTKAATILGLVVASSVSPHLTKVAQSNPNLGVGQWYCETAFTNRYSGNAVIQETIFAYPNGSYEARGTHSHVKHGTHPFQARGQWQVNNVQGKQQLIFQGRSNLSTHWVGGNFINPHTLHGSHVEPGQGTLGTNCRKVG